MDEAELAVIPEFTEQNFEDTVFLKFKGWHYTTPDAMPRTAFAAVASLAKEELEKTLREKSAKCILGDAENNGDGEQVVTASFCSVPAELSLA